MKKTAILLAALMCIGLFGCGEGKPAPQKEPAAGTVPSAEAPTPRQLSMGEAAELEGGFTEAIGNFANATAQKIIKEDTVNLCYSPISLYYALALAAQGAQGQTQSEMLDVLGVSDSALLAQQCRKLFEAMYKDDGDSVLKIADSVWVDDRLQGFSEDFAENAVKNFYSSLYTVDFADEATGDRISEWISDRTNGKLKRVGESDENQLMSIINAVYYCARWLDNFEEGLTREGTFKTAAGDVRCDFMNKTWINRDYYRGADYIRISLGLRGGAEMTFVLPSEGTNAYSLLAQGGEIWQGGTSGFGKVIFSMPKFEYKTSLSPTRALRDLGMKQAFETSADFGAMAQEPLFISDIMQGTFIAVNEYGVEAAAYTEMMMSNTSMPPETEPVIINLDRPFLYSLTDSTGAVLFMGICGDPTAK